MAEQTSCGTIPPGGVLERQGALDQLDGLLGEAAWDRGRLVLVRGEAGIGKTTLVEEFTSGRAQRVLWGTCDPVVPPRPLAPIFDIAATVGGALQAALVESDRHRILSAFLAVLRAEGGPWIAVIEDVQWADEATLEVLKIVGRRAAQLRALVIATYRDDEVGPDHPLSITLGDIPAASTVSISLAALSVGAVEQLSAGTAIDAQQLHKVTAGNPFFVTEVLAAGGADVPSTVREAVWARTKRLSTTGSQIVRAASVLGPRCDVEILGEVAAAAPEDVDICITGGMLRRHRSTIEFRHELERRAILESLSASERTRLHQRALTVLRDRMVPSDAAELARHAVEAGNIDAVLELAPKAGAEAAMLGAHKASLAHYNNALKYSDRLAPAAKASLLAAHAHECFVTDNPASAVASQEEAVSIYRTAAGRSAEGRAITDLAEYLWWNSESDRSHRTAHRAVEILESIEPDPNVARAYSRLAQISMMSGMFDIAIEWATMALAIGETFGAEAVIVHALNTYGVSQIGLGIDEGWSLLDESLGRATAAGLEEDIARALHNLIATSRENRLYDLFDKYSSQAAVFFDEHDLDYSSRCVIGDITDGLLERGHWAEAETQARFIVERGTRQGRVQCLAVLGRLAARRGDSDPFVLLDEALEEQRSLGGEITYPLRPARAEAAWLAGDLRMAAREIVAGIPAYTAATNPWLLGEFAVWAQRVGVDWSCPADSAEPYALLLDGHPEKSAVAWAALGCPYEEAQCLADTDEEDLMRRALSIFQSLGALAPAKAVSARLRDMGVRKIARGPRPVTRANPNGLSEREIEVLTLLAQGQRNTEIAKQLVISIRTVDHHVSAILAKLDVRSRYDAGQKAIAMGLMTRH
jgi:DNA-binding CsgD family transcriptional regulator/tetratricopeptide (TPR) repeat protein